MASSADTDDYPTAPSTSTVGKVWHGRPNGTDYGECRSCELEFEDKGEWEWHFRENHPLTCSKTGCKRVAAYRTANGSRYSGAAYCAPHMDSTGHEPWYVYNWVLDPANDHAPRLPEDHPIEAACRGLYGSREEAQRAHFASFEEES